MDLKIYGVILEVIELMQVEIRMIERRDWDLARQLRRAAASIARNTSEGSYSRGGNRKVRYHSALGSARETLACIEVAKALGYVSGVRSEIDGKLQQIIGTLMNLSR